MTGAVTCTCDYCGNPAELVNGSVIYPHRPDLHEKMFWRCVPCQAYVGCHAKGARMTKFGVTYKSDGTIPLGRLANAELRSWKSMVHAHVDPIWKEQKRCSRSRMYQMLAEHMNLPLWKCHVGMFDVEQCKRAVQFAVEEFDD